MGFDDPFTSSLCLLALYTNLGRGSCLTHVGREGGPQYLSQLAQVLVLKVLPFLQKQISLACASGGGGGGGGAGWQMGGGPGGGPLGLHCCSAFCSAARHTGISKGSSPAPAHAAAS
jgi:hypothetical protein